MAFSFMRSISHLPDDEHLEDEEQDDAQPMLRSGSVRAFSHLPVKRKAGDPTGPLSQRGAQSIGHQLQPMEPEDTDTPHQDGIAAAKASGIFDVVRQHYNRDDSPHFMDEDGKLRPRPETRLLGSTAPHASEDTRPWYMPPITHEDLHPQHLDQQDLHEFLQEHGHQPEIRQLQQRHGDDSAIHDLLHHTQSTDTEDMAHGAGSPPVLLAAQSKPPAQAAPGQQQERPFAGPPEPGGGPKKQDSSLPQARAEGRMPEPQNDADEQKKPKPEVAPKDAAAKRNPPGRRYTELENKELFTEDKRPRKPIGQLGITASSSIKDPNKTNSGRKPRTICLYDDKEDRKKTNDDVADATSLKIAAGTYASDGSWMIDISDPKWREQLKAIQRNEESSGRSIDRIMIFDHGGSAGQEFGGQRSKLDPNSKDWKIISSSVRPRGDIVLVGCEVAKTDWDYTLPHPQGQNRKMMTDGAAYVRDLYVGADSGRTPTIHAYDEKVRHREGRFQHSLTAGREHSYGLDGYKID
jgi:hypothetical protein